MTANPSAIEFTLTVRIPATRPVAFHTILTFHRVIDTLGVWRSRARQRRDLSKLDDRLLMDIDITSTARAVECAKPCWRA